MSNELTVDYGVRVETKLLFDESSDVASNIPALFFKAQFY